MAVFNKLTKNVQKLNKASINNICRIDVRVLLIGKKKSFILLYKERILKFAEQLFMYLVQHREFLTQ